MIDAPSRLEPGAAPTDHDREVLAAELAATPDDAGLQSGCPLINGPRDADALPALPPARRSMLRLLEVQCEQIVDFTPMLGRRAGAEHGVLVRTAVGKLIDADQLQLALSGQLASVRGYSFSDIDDRPPVELGRSHRHRFRIAERKDAKLGRALRRVRSGALKANRVRWSQAVRRTALSTGAGKTHCVRPAEGQEMDDRSSAGALTMRAIR